MTVAVAGTRPRAMRLLSAYLELTKPRIMFLVVITGVPALLMAAHGMPAGSRFWGALLGIALASSSAAAFNHWYDRDIDALMRRTRNRPLPSGLIAPGHALVFAFVLAALSWAALVLFGNLLAAVLGMVSIFYYAVVYTMWLKRRTPQNIVIGGGAGASAPLIAWAAVSGQLALPAALLAAIVFFWTPPHFWSLSLYRRDDYERAGLPMLPVTHGEPATRSHILAYTLVLVPVTLALAPLGFAGPLYWVPAAALCGIFIGFAARLWRSGSKPHAVQTFRFSILFLFLIFVLLTADAAARAQVR